MVKVKDVIEWEVKGMAEQMPVAVAEIVDVRKERKLNPWDEWVKDWDSWIERSKVELHFNKDWKIYFINSDNEDLLEELPELPKVKNRKTWEDEFQKCLPIQTIYQLLDAFYPYWYEFVVWDMREVGEYITTDKWGKEQKLTRKSLSWTLIAKTQLNKNYGNQKTIYFYVEWVVSDRVTISDSSNNGFVGKMIARAFKQACAKLGRVFRVSSEEEDIIDDTTGEIKKEVPLSEQITVYFQDEMSKLSNAWAKIVRADVVTIAASARTKFKIDKASKNNDVLKSVFAEFEKSVMATSDWETKQASNIVE